MGATDFYALHKCDTEKVNAQEAFDTLTSEARHEHGHGGYTGTIAEKTGFVVLNLPVENADLVSAWVQQQMDENPKIQDKWGPAGCVKLSGGWYFFGYASE